jgi:hypothetical protein
MSIWPRSQLRLSSTHATRKRGARSLAAVAAPLDEEMEEETLAVGVS